jgi:Stress responsive A/B Barrel Domain
MLTHLCLVTYKDPASVGAAEQKAIEAAYMQLPSIIPGITSMKVGRDVGLLEGNADLCILATFASADAFKAYSTHQAHMDVISPALGHHMASYSTAQFEG